MNRLALLLLLLAPAVTGFSQQGVTGQLTGSVSSAGQPVPGVEVTLTSTALQATRVTTTGANGGYLFALLPPADYRLHFELPGFTPADIAARVSLATLARVDIDLHPAPMSESIIVETGREKAPVGTLIASNIREDLLERSPGGRDIGSAVLLTSGATALGPHSRLIVAGAPSWDTLYAIDGVPVSEYLTGQPQTLFIEDAIEEIAIQSGAISAEFGRFTGGAVITLTKRGGNSYRGSLRDTMTNAAWTRRTPWPGQVKPFDHVDHTIEGTFGGFLLRNRLWFFSAGRNAGAAAQNFTTRTGIAYESVTIDRRWELKLTDQLTANAALIASYVGTSLEERNATDLRSAGRVLDTSALIASRVQPARLLALTYEDIVASDTFLQVHGSENRYALRGNGGLTRDRIFGTLVVARNWNANMNAPLGCGVCGDDARNRRSWSGKVSHYRNARAGNHTLDAGVEVVDEVRHNAGTRAASEFNLQAAARIVGAEAFPRFDGTTLIVWNRPRPSAGPRFESRAAYVNDRWDVGRLMLNLGLRYDRDHARDGAGQVIADGGAFSPRLSATCDVRGDDLHRLSVSFGRYGSKILESGGSPQQIGVFDQFGWRYLGPPINTGAEALLRAPDALRQLFAWFDSVGGIENREYLAFVIDPASTAFPHSLKPPVVDERTIGYARQFNAGFVRADYIARDWKNFYAGRVDTTTGRSVDASGNSVDVAWVINEDEGTIRFYRAFRLEGSWRGRRALAGGGYTLARLRGNDDE